MCSACRSRQTCTSRTRPNAPRVSQIFCRCRRFCVGKRICSWRAQTGRAVNVKKGQFLSPEEMSHVVKKLEEGNGSQIMLTERGTFFGYHRLVNDFIGLGDLMDLGWPVCFDITHSTQLPGGGTSQTAGRPERAPLLLQAAVAAGVDAIFIECHPEPAKVLSDASTMQPLDAMPELLGRAVMIHQAIQASLLQMSD